MASHRSAAAVWVIGGGDTRTPEILCPRWRRSQQATLIVHESKALDARESEMEMRMLQVLRANGLPDPVTQYEIRDRGRFVARVDAAYPDCRIALEYESFEWHTGKEALIRDSARRNATVGAGWLPIAVTWDDLKAGGIRVCTAILAARFRAA